MIDEEDDDTVAVQIDCENQNTVGNTIFVRDDRKKNEFFHVCEVEVFAWDEDQECGDPELALGSTLIKEGNNSANDMLEKTVACKEGLIMTDGVSDDINRTVITCTHGSWNSSHVKCECMTMLTVLVKYFTSQIFCSSQVSRPGCGGARECDSSV